MAAMRAEPGARLRAAAGGAELTLFGDVGWDITVAGVARALAGVAADAPLTVRINSFGGSAFEGVAIHNALARHRGPKTVIIEAIAASAASLVAMAGDEIVMPENAFLMIHNAWGAAAGDAGEMRDYAQLLDQISAAYRDTYARRTGRPADEITAIMDAETWFTAAEAVEAGFATHAAPPSEIVAYASARTNDFKRAPDAVRALISPPASAGTTPPAEPVQTQEVRMSETTNAAGGQSAPATQQTVTPVATLAQIQQIAAASQGRLGNDWVVEQLGASATMDTARDAAINAMASEPRRPIVTVVTDERDTFRARATAGLASRMAGERNPAPEAREFARLGLHGLMRESLAMTGERNVHRLDGSALWERMVQASGRHSTSDFPLILKDATNKRLNQYFEAVTPTWQAFTREFDVADFKAINTSSIGEFPSLQPVNEGGEVTYGSLAEEGESYAVKTNGRIVALTRQAIINDDLRAFEAVIRGAGEAGARLLLDKVYGELKTNANMADGNALFSTAHANVGAGASGTVYHYLVTPDRPTVEVSYLEGRRAPEVVGDEDFSILGISYRVVFDIGVKAVSWRGMARERAAVSEASIAALEKLLMEMKTVSGNFMAPAQRLVLLVPPSEFLASRKLATAITPASTTNVNIYGGRLSVIEEPRLA